MRLQQLIEEGRALMRPTVLLRPQGAGTPAARWYGLDAYEVDEDDNPCWLTVDCRFIPNWPLSDVGFLSVFTAKRNSTAADCVELSESWPVREGLDLFAESAEILAPIDAIIARGSPAIDEWLAENKWRREWRYNDNFRDQDLVNEYELNWQTMYPIYRDDVFAALGGWHYTGPDGDWHDLIDSLLCVLTIRDAEPWVEAWRLPDGTFRVIQRIT